MLFLPVFLELRKLKDGDLRLIIGSIPEVNIHLMHFFPTKNFKDEQRFDISMIQIIAKS
jgi:hypothetical protein